MTTTKATEVVFNCYSRINNCILIDLMTELLVRANDTGNVSVCEQLRLSQCI
jgi:hypothetical protein